jgi:hypothetical protein
MSSKHFHRSSSNIDDTSLFGDEEQILSQLFLNNRSVNAVTSTKKGTLLKHLSGDNLISVEIDKNVKLDPGGIHGGRVLVTHAQQMYGEKVLVSPRSETTACRLFKSKSKSNITKIPSTYCAAWIRGVDDDHDEMYRKFTVEFEQDGYIKTNVAGDTIRLSDVNDEDSGEPMWKEKTLKGACGFLEGEILALLTKSNHGIPFVGWQLMSDMDISILFHCIKHLNRFSNPKPDCLGKFRPLVHQSGDQFILSYDGMFFHFLRRKDDSNRLEFRPLEVGSSSSGKGKSSSRFRQRFAMKNISNSLVVKSSPVIQKQRILGKGTSI